MTDELGVDELVTLLLDEDEYGGTLPPKAVHKILYFAEQELAPGRVSVDLPKFWYMYGTMVATADTGVNTGGEAGDGQVSCYVSVTDIDASDHAIRHGRDALSDALQRYYELGLEGLTDEMYREAPYDVQRYYRRLDKQLETASDTQQMTLGGGRNEKRTRESLYDFVEAFPIDDFPDYENDLHIWYRLMSAEVDSEDYEPERAQQLAETFWRLFCLELACRENDGISREEIANELGIDSVEQVKKNLRSSLRSLEREKAHANARDTDGARKAAEAFVVPHLDFEVTP